MKRQNIAKNLHKKGYNCAQAFLCSYQKDLDIDEKILFKMAEGLGRGVGGLEEMCCIPIIMSMIVSYLETSDGNLNYPQSKHDSYACSKCLSMEFKEKNETLKCYKILENHKKSDKCCTDLIIEGIEMLDECLRLKEKGEA